MATSSASMGGGGGLSSPALSGGFTTTSTSNNNNRARATSSSVSQGMKLNPTGGQTLTRMRSRSLLRAAGGNSTNPSLDLDDDCRQQFLDLDATVAVGPDVSTLVPSSYRDRTLANIMSSAAATRSNLTLSTTAIQEDDDEVSESLLSSSRTSTSTRTSFTNDRASSSPNDFASMSGTPSLHYSDGSSSTSTHNNDDDYAYSPPNTPTLVASSAAVALAAASFLKSASSKLVFASLPGSALSAISPIDSTPRRELTLRRQRSHQTIAIPPTPKDERSSFEQSGGMGIANIITEEDYLHPASHSRPQLPRLMSSSYTRQGPAHEIGNGVAARPITSSTATIQALTSSTSRNDSLMNLLPPILFLLAAFCISLVGIYYAISTIPLTLPHNVSQIKQQATALREYSRKGLSQGLHVTAVLSALFVFKQAFSVPGSILVNILFGSLYGTYAATLYACLFTGIGSVLAYYMAHLCSPLVERYCAKALSTTRASLLSGSSADLFSYLLLARLFPLLPYSVLNVACGVLKIPVKPYFITLVLGSFPYNFVTTQLGDLLGNLANSAEAGSAASAIWTWSLCFKLAVASVLSAAPLLFKEQLKSFIGSNNKPTTTSDSGARPSSVVLPRLRRHKSISSPAVDDNSSIPFMHEQGTYSLSDTMHPSMPMLRRGRADSAASDVLLPAYPVSMRKSQHSHKRSLSLRIKDSWHALRAGCSSFATHGASSSLSSARVSRAASFDSPSRRQPHRHVASASHLSISLPPASPNTDEESGDTDREDARGSMQRVLSSVSAGSIDSSHRRLASVDLNGSPWPSPAPAPARLLPVT